MIRIHERWRGVGVALAGAAFLACAKADQTSQSADSTARNLTLAPAESTAALKDVPAQSAQRASPAPQPKTARPVAKPVARPAPAAPAAPVALTLAAGTRVPLAVSDTLSTRHAKVGDPFTASVSQAVTDPAGRVVIPAGATVQGTIDAADARTPLSGGRLALTVHSVTVGGTSYTVQATVVSEDTVTLGRGVDKGAVEKAGAGAAIGAIAGGLIGKNAKGAIIGGLAGAAGGAAVARETRSIDFVLPKGAALTITLDQPLTVKR